APSWPRCSRTSSCASSRRRSRCSAVAASRCRSAAPRRFPRRWTATRARCWTRWRTRSAGAGLAPEAAAAHRRPRGWTRRTSSDHTSSPPRTRAALMTRITLLTDFGTADGYVAAMKGVIAARAPGIVIDDASHDIPPGDVAAAAWTLSRYWNLYPPGTVHVVVVDPGVGSERRALAAEVDGRLFVAPDNGVLTWVLAEAGDAAVVAIEAARLFRTPVSATFHGRDVFAPVAAELARRAGAGPSRFREVLADLGPEVADPVRLPLPRPHRGPD